MGPPAQESQGASGPNDQDIRFLQSPSHTLLERLGSPGLRTQTRPLKVLSPTHKSPLSPTCLHPAARTPCPKRPKCPSVFAHSSAPKFSLPAKTVPRPLKDRRRRGSGPEQEQPPPLSALTIHVLHGVHAQAGIYSEPQPALEPEESDVKWQAGNKSISALF